MYANVFCLAFSCWISYKRERIPLNFGFPYSTLTSIMIEEAQIEGAPVESYEEKIVSSKDWIQKNTDNPVQRLKQYVISLFPIAQWIYRYNLTWLYGDLIAGLTVGCVVVPQGMSYAKLAQLPAEYGLYSSFVGVFIYCFFATSKDVSIGPVAVMSLQVGRAINKVIDKHPEFSDQGPLIAVTLSLICGGVSAGIGLLRFGFILEFIPIPAVMGFMTGSAFSIIVGQIPALFGVSKRLDTRAATYLVVINFLKQIKHTTIDAAFGIVCLTILFALKFASDYGQKRLPKWKVPFFYLGVLRNALVIVFATIISYGCFKNHKENPAASIIKTVPSGLRHLGVPAFDSKIISALASELPVSIIVLLLEHIAISKSFGRINDYKIVPDQELIAIGVTNLIGIFFAAYPATGSFSRSALKSKCGVRTPLAGIYTGAVVLLALYALTDAFYWIPNATLSAVIIHAVCDLMSHPRATWKLWLTSPLEAIIFVAAVVITVFVTIEAGIYFSISASAALLLLRIAKAKGEFLGRVEYFEVINPNIISPAGSTESDPVSLQCFNEQASNDSSYPNEKKATITQVATQITPIKSSQGSPFETNSNIHRRYKWVPLSLKSYNPQLKVLPPPPGVIVFRPNESFTYPNCSRQVDLLMDEVKRLTKSGRPSVGIKLGDRPWNDHGPRRMKESAEVDERPLLRAVVLDFSSVPYLDSTGVQNLADIRQAINRYVDADVEYHFVGIISPWTRRALVVEGFGGGTPNKHVIGVSSNIFEKEYLLPRADDEESGGGGNQGMQQPALIPVLSTETPFFHAEIPDLD